MKRIAAVAGIILFFGLGFVESISQQETSKARQLIESGVDCNTLSDTELELIGEFQMERMHPDDAHELMHGMMGLEEGSEEETRFHINLAKTAYCGKSYYGAAGPGGMAQFFGGAGMMGSGGMMGDGGAFGAWSLFGLVFWLLLLAGLFLLVAWLYRNVASHVAGEEPVTVLKRRYAGGEITKKEFEGMKKELSGR